jgi:hypothetical protein
MKRWKCVVAVAAVSCARMLWPAVAGAADPGSLIEAVRQGCAKELGSYCAQVTPGEGRQLACLYAFGDKLSGRCEYALYDASVQLERAVSALSYVARECQADIQSHCASVSPGQGRILDCMKKHSSQLSPRCSSALGDVGAK